MKKLILPEKLEKDEEKGNVVPFQPQVVLGGKDPTINWLETLPQGTVFLCAPRTPQGQNNIFGLEYHVIFKTETFTKIFENMNEEHYHWVHTKNFSRAFEFIKVLAQPEEEE